MVAIGQIEDGGSLLDELYDLILDDVIRADPGFKSFLIANDNGMHEYRIETASVELVLRVVANGECCSDNPLLEKNMQQFREGSLWLNAARAKP